MTKWAKDAFDITPYYGQNWQKIDWKKIEKTQLGMWWGESVVYHNSQEILKVFAFNYKHAEQIFLYHDALEAYKKRHTFLSKYPIHINTKDIARWDVVLHQHSHDNIRESKIDTIIIKTIPLHDALLDIHADAQVVVMKNIPYIPGVSLQSMCHGPYQSKGITLKDTKDLRTVKVGPKEVYRIWYNITSLANQEIYRKYGIYCGEIMILFMICHTGLVPKNMKLTQIDLATKTLIFEATDRCSDIMFRYICNHQNALFQNFIKSDILVEQTPWLLETCNNAIDKFKHMIARSYIHK